MRKSRKQKAENSQFQKHNLGKQTVEIHFSFLNFYSLLLPLVRLIMVVSQKA